MVQALGIRAKRTLWAASLLGVFALGAAAQEDPPTRVARLNYMNGNVSMEPAGVDDWAPAVVNRPFTTGDYIYTDDGAQAELHMDIAVIRMGSQTSFGFLNLGDQMVQLKITEGDMDIRLRHFSSDQVFEVDTPNGAVTLLQNGVYRFRVDPNGQWSYTVVREGGQAQVTGGGQAFILDQNESANVSGTDQVSYDVEAAPEPDDFDNWVSQRDAHEASLRASQYVADSVIGYEDLDDNGDWSDGGDYGQVWYPRGIEAGWAPYHNGHWAWIDPWGWTWNDDAQWGFAPFHYGRWVYYRDRWGWAPGPRGEGRPYYAPAMVAWFGGSHFGVSIGIGGGGPSLGWVPLGYGEVYTPPYTCSQRYFTDVNTYNTRVTNVNITNVYNTVYVNHTAYNQTFVNTRAPNAVMAMPQSAFASGRPVHEVARAVPAAQVAQIQTARVIAPPVAPTRQSVMPSAVAGRSAPRPPAQVMQRQVVARVTPPPPPAPFTARQQYLAQHAATGQPVNHAAMRAAIPAPHAAPAVRVATAPTAKPMAVHPGARVGNPVVAARPGTVPQPGHVAPAGGQPGRPGEAPRPEERTAPQPAAHGAPPNRPGAQPPAQPAARTPQPPPNRPEERTAPQPAAHGAPPNRPAEQPAARTPQPPPARPEERPAPQPAARTPQPPPNRPEERTAPQPAAHGAPPNRPAAQPAPQPAARTPQPPPNRPAEQPAARTPQPPPARPAERPAAQPAPRPAERPAPPPSRPAEQPAARPAPQPAARPAERPAPPPSRPAEQPAARPAPQPAARPAERPAQPAPRPAAPPPSRPAPESRPAPAPARPESKPAPPPAQHGAPPPAHEKQPPKDTKDTKH